MTSFSTHCRTRRSPYRHPLIGHRFAQPSTTVSSSKSDPRRDPSSFYGFEGTDSAPTFRIKHDDIHHRWRSAHRLLDIVGRIRRGNADVVDRAARLRDVIRPPRPISTSTGSKASPVMAYSPLNTVRAPAAHLFDLSNGQLFVSDVLQLPRDGGGKPGPPDSADLHPAGDAQPTAHLPHASAYISRCKFRWSRHGSG